MLGQKPPAAETSVRFKEKLGLWLVAASRKDIAGKMWDAHAPIHNGQGMEPLARLLALSPGTPAVLDAIYADQDEEYLDAMALARVLSQSQKP